MLCISTASAAPTILNPKPSTANRPVTLYDCKMMGLYAQLWAITPENQVFSQIAGIYSDNLTAVIDKQMSTERALAAMGLAIVAKGEYDLLPLTVQRKPSVVGEKVEATCAKKYVKTM